MRKDSFSQEALYDAYSLAAKRSETDFEEFAEDSRLFDLPDSSSRSKREKLFERRSLLSQLKANKTLDKQRKIQEKIARMQELQMKNSKRDRS
jgi:hypothetical protein